MTTKDGSTWLISIRAKESRVVKCSSSANDKTPTFNRDDAQKSSIEFCLDTYKAIPSRDGGSQKTYDDNNIYFGLYWISDQSGCKPQSQDFTWIENCKEDVLNIVDSCKSRSTEKGVLRRMERLTTPKLGDVDTMTEKHGGTEVLDTAAGCWGYSAVKEAGHD